MARFHRVWILSPHNANRHRASHALEELQNFQLDDLGNGRPTMWLRGNLVAFGPDACVCCSKQSLQSEVENYL